MPTQLEQTIQNHTEEVDNLCECGTPIPKDEKICYSCAGYWDWMDSQIDAGKLGD